MNYQGQNAQSQQYAARQRQIMSMLPPQYQNLTPQQLQELKNQPQFQNMLRQYFQKQQMMQQQAQQQMMRKGQNQNLGQSQAMPMDGMPMGQGMGMNMAQNAGANPVGQNLAMGQNRAVAQNMPQSVQNMTPQQQQIYNRNVQAAYLQQQKMRQMSGQMPSVGGAVNPAARGAVPKLPGTQMPPRVPQQSVEAGQGMSPQAAAAAAVAAAKYGTKGSVGGMSSAMPTQASLSAVAASFALEPSAANDLPEVSQEQIKLPPKFAPDSAKRVQLRPMKSATEWSEKLEEEGKEVPLDLKMYESVIQKDEAYLKRAQTQGQRSRDLLERMARDIKTYNGIKQLRMNSISASAKNQYNNSIWGEGYQGYGNSVSNTATQVVYTHQNKSFLRVPIVPYTEAHMNDIVLKSLGKGKDLVPIRLNFDQERDRFKLRDTFLWDLNDESFPIESFVKLLLEDYKFISELHFHTVLASVNEQIKDYRKVPDKSMGEIRVPIKIDFVMNNTQFTDQFEWDILNFGESDPEDFATILCDEMSLPGEFASAIAFSIREQAQMYHKALFLVGYSFDGSFIREDEIRSNLLPALRILTSDGQNQIEDFVSTLRNPSVVADFSPSINNLTQLEVEKIDKEMERENRRRRRHLNNENQFSYNENGPNLFGPGRGTASRRSALHSGRGVKMTLPDLSEIPKTFRTPVPSSVLPGGIDLGVPDVYGYNELIINRTQIKDVNYKPPAPPGMVTTFKDTAGSFYVKIRLRKNYHG